MPRLESDAPMVVVSLRDNNNGVTKLRANGELALLYLGSRFHKPYRVRLKIRNEINSRESLCVHEHALVKRGKKERENSRSNNTNTANRRRVFGGTTFCAFCDVVVRDVV